LSKLLQKLQKELAKEEWAKGYKISWDDLEFDMAECKACHWEGPIASCRLTVDENINHYENITYHVCPLCDLCNTETKVRYTYSSLAKAIDDARIETLK